MRPAPTAHRLSDLADLAALVEALCWIAAWLVLPAWLGFGRATGWQYLCYALGSGMIMAAGVIGSNFARFRSDPRFAVEFSVAAIVAVAIFGGIVFGFARLVAA